METFIETAGRADTLAAVDFTAVQQFIEEAAGGSNVDDELLRESITTLVDTYSAADSSQAVLQRALMKAIGCILRATALDGGGRLVVDDYILLALFFNEVSTAGDAQLFSLLTDAVAALFQQTVIVAFGSSPAADDNDTDGCSSVASLRGELRSLWLLMAKRLVSSPVGSEGVSKPYQNHDTAMQLKIVDCLRVLLLSLLRAADEGTATLSANGERRKGTNGTESTLQAARQVVEGILLPLSAVVDTQRPSAADSSGSAGRLSAAQFSSNANGAVVSPLVLVGTFRVVEELLWRCTGHGAADSIVVIGRFAVNRLLETVQRYLVFQQQKSVGSTGADVQEKNSAVFDLLRAAGPQRAIRRLLSVVQRQLQVFPAIESAVAAAVSVFGGALDIGNLPWPIDSKQNGTAFSESGDDGRDDKGGFHIALKEWEETPASPTSRLRLCEQILPAPTNDVVVNEGATAEFDDPTLMADGAEGGSQEVLLKSTAGPISANVLVEMVFLSISRLDIMDEQAIQSLHLQGLQQQQYEAVRRAQRSELQRLRHIERQGVENIPVGRLLEHLKESTAIYASGAQLLDSESGLAMVQRAALFSILDAYDLLADAPEVRVRESQALIARAVTQMPSSMIDSVLDYVCARLRQELNAVITRHKANGGVSAVKIPSVASVYQLALQILFTLYSAQAPVQERCAKALMFAASPSSVFATMGSEPALQSRVIPTIDPENPMEWLHAPDVHALQTDRKRPRGETDTFHRVGAGVNEDEQSETSGPSQFFREDSIQAPCAYSHFLCRVMEVLTEVEAPGLLLELLLQCPRITRYTWHYLHKYFCLSAEKARCLLGVWLLKNVATRRVVYRRYALNSLLHITTSWSEYPRRLAVKQLGILLSSSAGPGGRRVIDGDGEALLIRHAKRQIAAIPVTKLPEAVTAPWAAAAKVEGGGEITAGRTAANQGKEMQRLSATLDRNLGSFLMLCARQPRELIPALLDVFKECVERENTVMVQLLMEHLDVRRMFERLFQRDALSFMSNVMPYLRRYSGSATALIQKVLWAISAELRLMAKSSETPPTDLDGVATALLGHARVMYEDSQVPFVYRAAAAAGSGSADDVVSIQGSRAVLHDIRFIAPFMSLIPTEELKRVYLRSFLHFVEQQLQQRSGVAAGEDATLVQLHMGEEEISHLIRDVMREVLVRSPVNINDGVPRGLSRVDLLVYLHCASHGEGGHLGTGQQGSPSPSAAGASSGIGAETRGVLSASDTPSSAAGGAGYDGMGKEIGSESLLTVESLPLSALTTKEVICTLLKLRRTFDESTTEFLYGPTEIKGAVRQLMKNVGTSQVPSQLMATLIFACGLQPQRIAVDLVRFVLQEVLLPLAKDTTWEKDVQLWRGVLLFAEMHYRECSSFLVNLPDQVLIDALRALPQLCEYFREEHGNNAYFGHILGSL